jgi:hypothetical protein
MAQWARGNTAKRRRRSERIWTSTSADASESVLPVADSARSRRHVRMQGNRLRASRLRARDAGAKEGLAHEQVDPGGSRRSWPSEPIRLYRLVPKVHDVQQFLPSLIAQPTAITTNHRGDYLFGHSLPTTIPGKLLHHPRNLITVKYFSSSILFIVGIHFPPVLLHNQGYPKVCFDSLNLPNAGDSFAGISSLSFHSLFSPTRDLIASI